MFMFAKDNPIPATIVLISGDRDFAIATSRLRNLKYRVVLISPPSAHFSLIRTVAVNHSWYEVIPREVVHKQSRQLSSGNVREDRSVDTATTLAEDSPVSIMTL